PSTVAYLDARITSPSEICQLFVSKLGFAPKIDVSGLLYSTDWEDREKSLREIAFIGGSEHLERITELMLSDPVDRVREAAAWTLDNLNDPRSLPALVDAIHDPYFGVRSAAGWALVHLGENLVRADMDRIYRESDNLGARRMTLLVLQNLHKRTPL
ncbi:MAG: HEAT repeat domain-containing protein, partial [Caldilineaceae bacterium]|nr:HEAT repeat domain-containing protein [Caldilineaceae bacterium]